MIQKLIRLTSKSCLGIRTVILCTFLGFSISLFTGNSGAANPSTHQAGLAVQFADGNVEIRCVYFDEESISGYELLLRSEIPIVAAFSSQGAAICKIGEDGCPAENCFCQSPPDYWSYWRLTGGEWIYSPVGASSSQVVDGDVEGWRWGSGLPPGEVISIETICAQPTETLTPVQPTASKTATNTSTPTRIHTPTLTKTPIPSATLEWIVLPTDAPLVVVQMPTETTAINLPTFTSSPAAPATTETPTPTFTSTSTSTSSFTPTVVPSITATQTTQMNPTNAPVFQETVTSPVTTPFPTSQKRKLEVTPTPTRRQGLQKSQSTALALAPADSSAAQVEGEKSRPNYARFALLTGGVIGYFVFLLLFGGLAVGLMIVWMVRRK